MLTTSESREESSTHDADRVARVFADLAIDENIRILVSENGLDFSGVESVFELVLEDDGERDRLSELVRALRRSDSPDAAQLREHPTLGSSNSLQMFLGSSCLEVVKEGTMISAKKKLKSF